MEAPGLVALVGLVATAVWQRCAVARVGEQQQILRRKLRGGAIQSEPCDHDDPNPVGFLTVRPEAQFVVVLGGPPDWTALAGQLLRESLAQRGVGGKTNNAYGRATLTDARAPAPPPSAAVAEFSAWLDEARDGAIPQRDLLARIRNDRLERLHALSDDDRTAAAVLVRRAIKSARLKEQVDALCAEIKDSAP